MIHRGFGLAVLSLAVSFPVHAQWLGEHVDTILSLRGDVWSGSRQLDERAAIAQISAWGQTKFDLDSFGKLVGSGWLREQARRDADTPRGRVRELYWRNGSGPVEWKIGRQMIVWGRADGINPTDNLSPRDFTLLAPEDGDLRYGNEAAQVSISTAAGSFSGIWFPHATSHTLPLPQQANVSYSVQSPPRKSQWAIKWETSGNAIDGSLSYFQGADPTPDFEISGLGPAGLEIAVGNHPARILGGDLSFTRGGVVWRAEAAWMQTDSVGASDFTRKKPQVWLVAGGEWQLSSGTTLGVEGSLQKVMHFENPDSIAVPIAREVAWRQATVSNQTAATQLGIIWRLASRWRNDTVLAETSGVLSRSPGSGVWRTKLDFAVDDHLHLQAGSDYYFGPERSFWGQFNKNRLIYVQARYSW